MRDANPARTPADDREGRLELWRVLAIVVVVGIAIALTFLVNNYRLFQLSMTISYACAVLSLTILTGINGQLSLGHGAFYAVGAYATAILMSNYDWPYWATIPVAAVAAGIVGFLVGFPALRLAGLYLALVTLALAVAAPQILKINALSDLTGGVQGLTTDKAEAPFGLPLNPDQWIYLFCLAIGCVVFLLGWNLTRGRTGRAMMAIRDQSLAAESMGINLAAVKTRTFAVSAGFAGVAGALTTIVVQFVAPDSFNLFISIWFFVGLVVGGVASVPGALFGGAFIEFVPNIANDISKAAPGAIYGLILIAFMYVLPTGVAGGLHRLFRRLSGRRKADARASL
jgi:branched-chain amino acid transport system permease protein